MKVELGIGVLGVLIGLALMLTGQRMCRGTCWIDDVFKMLLPSSYESLAGGLPALLAGLAIIAHALYKGAKK
ncbi:hypothetical protein [Variovorax sp. WS11]|uniref:hypothetical protein n=1 Tax=Variovorax sp. WS11 TaxID=1105204 RepID=UPI0011B1FF7F|nr:hypothetical protein [Variovorax sp. WS11]NDZ15405.1 hypothetical protein [Variovorax sp. WS11]